MKIRLNLRVVNVAKITYSEDNLQFHNGDIMEYHEDHEVYFLGRRDPYVFTEQKRDYGRIAHRAAGKRVLDFGGHCGFF